MVAPSCSLACLPTARGSLTRPLISEGFLDRDKIPESMPTLRHDRAIVLAAVAQNGLALQHATTFQADREVVLVAVKQNGKAIQLAAETLQADRGIVMVAIAQDGLALRHLPIHKASRKRAKKRKKEKKFDTHDSDKRKVENDLAGGGAVVLGEQAPFVGEAVAAATTPTSVDNYMEGSEDPLVQSSGDGPPVCLPKAVGGIEEVRCRAVAAGPEAKDMLDTILQLKGKGKGIGSGCGQPGH